MLDSLPDFSFDKVRLLALCAPNSGDWIRIIPRNKYFNLPDDEFELAVNMRLGRPLIPLETYPVACLCGTPITKDAYGLPHFLENCPAFTGLALYARHQHIVSALEFFMRSLGIPVSHNFILPLVTGPTY